MRYFELFLLTLYQPHVFTKAEKEWHDAGKLIANFVALIPGLEELT